MIDLHCHILPGVDDGSTCLEESVEMARMAAASGVTAIAATPHFEGTEAALPRLASFRRRLDALRAAIEEAHIPLTLHAGAEILCLPETPELAAMHRLPTYEGTRYILTEFFFDERFSYMDTLLTRLATHGYRPVIAHPERYMAIQREPERLAQWVERGWLLQVNKGSVLGAFGSKAEDTAHALLALGFIHALASDAHSCTARTPHMARLCHWVQEHCEENCGRILLTENPRRILEGKPPVE